LETYRSTGRKYDAEIINLSHVIGINMGWYTPTVCAECVYVNEAGQRCKVKSSMFMWENFKHDKLQAEVYTDWDNPQKYAVAITQREDVQAGIDIDYT
jgi:hypothetical protein